MKQTFMVTDNEGLITFVEAESETEALIIARKRENCNE